MGKNLPEGVVWKDRKRTLFGLPISFTKYILKNDRMFIETGFFHQHIDEIRLRKITDVNVCIKLGQKIFRTGKVECISFDDSAKTFDLVVKNPRKVRDLISDLAEENRKGGGVDRIMEFMNGRETEACE